MNAISAVLLLSNGFCRWPVKKKQALPLLLVAVAAVGPVRAPLREKPLKPKKKRANECVPPFLPYHRAILYR